MRVVKDEWKCDDRGRSLGEINHRELRYVREREIRARNEPCYSEDSTVQ